MAQDVAILGPDGRALPRATPTPARGKTRAALGGSSGSWFPYGSADWFNQELGTDWLPFIRSPDNEINIYRDRMVARARDLDRNDGWVRGGTTRILDNAVGANFRLSARPDYRALALMAKGFDEVWAGEFRDASEAYWRSYANDPVHLNDVEAQLTVAGQFRLALRHKLIDGEALAVEHWFPEQIDEGGFATTLLLVDPDRLSNPFDQVDTRYLRGGVEIDDRGRPVAYHIRQAHQYDWYNAVQSMIWDRIPARMPDGRPIVIHDYERDRITQHRGIGAFQPVLTRLKMLARYDSVELQAAIVNAIFGAFVTSPYDHDMVQQALEAGDDGEAELSWMQKLRSQFHQEHNVQLNGVRIPILFPSEKIETVAANRPTTAFDQFSHAMLRNVSAALGTSAEQITQDWSKTNYSSARGAILEAWKTLVRRREEFAVGFATPHYGAWLEEAMDRDMLPLPRNAPEYREARAAYSRCKWIGPGRGWVDPVKEAQGAVLRLDASLTTLEAECAEQGLEMEEVLHQRKREIELMEKLGVPRPEWARAIPAADTTEKPVAT